MNYMPDIRASFETGLKTFETSAFIQKILSGSLNKEHYKWALRQVFHHARENPQIQALATVYFRGEQRRCVKTFYHHATSEIGHDQLALNDLKELGEDVEKIPYENPLPATTALLAFPFYQIRNLNPVGYLGYLFFLEFTPTSSGKTYIQHLQNIGIPESATTFLHDHATIDIAHNKLMEQYVEELVRSDDDYHSVVYALKVTGILYARMLEGAIEQADAPLEWGVNPMEGVAPME